MVGQCSWRSDASVQQMAFGRPTGDVETILPPLESDYNSTALCRRLDLRTSTLLLGALPNGLKSELVAARHMSTGAILYRIMRNYQPGGLQAKSETLQALTLTQPGKSPRDATEKLQRWRRHQLRARELCATLPDATILCKSLGVIVAEVLSTAPQASFRLNSFRLQSRLDVMPTTENLEQYYQMLLAEMETLALMPEQILEGGLAKPAAIKAMQILEMHSSRFLFYICLFAQLFLNVEQMPLSGRNLEQMVLATEILNIPFFKK